MSTEARQQFAPNRIEEWIALWVIVALINKETTPARLRRVCEKAALSIREKK